MEPLPVCALAYPIRYIALNTTRNNCSLLEMLNEVDKA